MLWLASTKSMANPYHVTDSVKMVHVIDGNISEWNPSKFEMDPRSKTFFSADNDGQNLYVVLKISDPRMQIKMMTGGMSMFIDKKGKKREGSGIQFPLKSNLPSSSGRGGEAGAMNPRQVGEKVAPRLLFVRPFGLENLEDDKMILLSPSPGMINIAYDWDEANNMYIEYLVPLSFIGPAASLNGKPLSIGWQVHAGETPSGGNQPNDAAAATATTSKVVRVPAGSPPPSIERTRSTSNFAQDNGANEPIMWTKYVLTF